LVYTKIRTSIKKINKKRKPKRRKNKGKSKNKKKKRGISRKVRINVKAHNDKSQIHRIQRQSKRGKQNSQN